MTRSACCVCGPLDGGDETDDGLGGDDDDDDDDDEEEATGARPRRISELKIPNKVKPIPLASSLFIFAPTNRSAVSLYCLRCSRLVTQSHSAVRAGGVPVFCYDTIRDARSKADMSQLNLPHGTDN